MAANINKKDRPAPPGSKRWTARSTSRRTQMTTPTLDGTGNGPVLNTSVTGMVAKLSVLAGGQRHTAPQFLAADERKLRDLVAQPNITRPGGPGPDWCRACPCPWEALAEAPEEFVRTHRAVVGRVAGMEVVVEQTETVVGDVIESESVVTIDGKIDLMPKQAAEMSRLLIVAGYRAEMGR